MKQLPGRLGADEGQATTTSVAVSTSISDGANRLRYELVVEHGAAPALLPLPPAVQQPSWLLVDLYDEEPARDLVSGLERGVLDQKLIYLHSTADRTWRDLTEDKDYSNHAECLDGLDKLIRSDEWRGLDKARQLNTVVDLGVGTGLKASSVVNLLRGTRPRCRVSVLGIDISWAMLASGVPFIQSRVGPDVRVAAVRADFARQLGEVRGDPKVDTWFRSSGGNSIFLLLGNTFCNLHEAECLNSPPVSERTLREIYNCRPEAILSGRIGGTPENAEGDCIE